MAEPRVSVITPFKVDTEEQVGWLIDAARSVEKQTFDDWELVLVNDHSEADLKQLKAYLGTFPREKLTTRSAESHGTARARNQAARVAQGELLLPLDADDALPKDALELMVNAWDDEGREQGIVFGDVLLFGQDWQRVQKGEVYDFRTLLHRLYMLVGSLHRKADWKMIGGWKSEMEHGLEDWEYWIALGEEGVCGYYLPVVTYHYRKHTQGRLAWLRKDEKRFQAALRTMREMHNDVYKGRLPVGCCGKGATKAPRPATSEDSAAASTMSREPSPNERINIVYYGGQRGSFFVTGRSSGTRYKVMGYGKPVIDMHSNVGVLPEDVQFILALGGGGVFRRAS